VELRLKTDFGEVLVRASGHYIEVYTPIETYSQTLINLWDYEQNRIEVALTVENVLHEVIESIREALGSFELLGIELVDIALDELVDDDVISRISEKARLGITDATGT
jgi:hypothetical protein